LPLATLYGRVDPGHETSAVARDRPSLAPHLLAASADPCHGTGIRTVNWCTRFFPYGEGDPPSVPPLAQRDMHAWTGQGLTPGARRHIIPQGSWENYENMCRADRAIRAHLPRRAGAARSRRSRRPARGSPRPTIGPGPDPDRLGSRGIPARASRELRARAPF